MERIGFMFAGQGAQCAGMGKKLAEEHPEAMAVFQKADELLGFSLSRICFEGTLEELTPCAMCQPAIYTVSMASYAVYMAKNPDLSLTACGGLSLGEFSAACAAGIMDFETGLRLVAERGRLMDSCCRANPGGMAAVLGGEPQGIAEVCEETAIDIANYNCPGQIVISGEEPRLAAAMEKLEQKGYRIVKLTVAGAYHSRLMRPAAEAFGKILSTVNLQRPKCPFYQNVVGKAVDSPDEIRLNLQKQVCSSVRWESCAVLMKEQCDTLVEFGPGNVLSGFMKRIDRKYPVSKAE